MSLLGIFGPYPHATGKSGGSGKTQQPAGTGDAPKDDSPAAGGSTATTGGTAQAGGGAPAEQAQAPAGSAALPPTTPARATPAVAAPRAGADGGDTVAAARTGLTDADRLAAAFAPDADAARARRYAEAERDRLVAQEILSRIPVPVDAIPSLGLAAERASQASPPRGTAPDSAA